MWPLKNIFLYFFVFFKINSLEINVIKQMMLLNNVIENKQQTKHLRSCITKGTSFFS